MSVLRINKINTYNINYDKINEYNINSGKVNIRNKISEKSISDTIIDDSVIIMVDFFLKVLLSDSYLQIHLLLIE